MDIESLKFDGDGLIPAVVQDFYSRRVLMVAWMSRESLEITLREGHTCFWSRSRRELWRKGETSGSVQRLVRLTADCDGDTLLCEVMSAGPACHTGAESCFFGEIYADGTVEDFTVDRLYELIRGRKTERTEGSYTTYLFEKGEDKILKKVGEETAEVIVAAKNNDGAELRNEIADLAYHLLVLMVEKGLPIGAVREELAGRHVVDKKVKQERMG